MGASTLFAAVLAVNGLAVAALAATGRGRLAVLGLAAGFVAFNYVFVLRALPDAERLKPVPPIAELLNARAAAGSVVASQAVSLPSLVYYLQRPVRDTGTVDRAGDLLDSAEDVWLVTGAREWEALRRRTPSACEMLRLPDFAFNARLPAIMRQAPPPDIVVISNRCAG